MPPGNNRIPEGASSGGPDYEDDKYAKFSGKNAPESLQKYHKAAGALGLQGVTDKHLYAFFRNSFVIYTLFLITSCVVYECLGGSFRDLNLTTRLRFASAMGEAFGLLSLRRKIESNGNVSGISGMTMVMYGITYMFRLFTPPPFSWAFLDDWFVQVLGFTAFIMVLDVLRSIFKTYRSTYETDFDTLNVKFLVPGCVLMAVLIRPAFQEGPWYSFIFAVQMYLDAVALMPQVVFMQRGGGRVQAPISHFVAATAVSRSSDVWFWITNLHAAFYLPGDSWSPWIMVAVQILTILLIADFMYHYVKARMAGAKFSEDLDLTDACVDV